MMMNRIALAALTAAAGLASAQTAVFTYSGTVVSVEGDPQFFDLIEVGQDADGAFSFDVSTSSGIPNIPGLGFNFYTAQTFSLTVGNAILASDEPVALVFNDTDFFANADDPSTSNLDGLVVAGALAPNDAGPGQVNARFLGEPIWFSDTDLPSASTLGLENLLEASVIIEFSIATNVFDENGNLLPQDQWIITSGRAEIRVDEIRRDGTTVATIGCRPAQFASPVARADVFDVLGYIDSFVASEPAADFNADGSLDFFDVVDFLRGFEFCGN